MRIIIRCASILLLLIISTMALYSQEISGIRIEGDLTKTRESTILKIIEVQAGDLIVHDDIEEIRQRLLRSGLFVDDTVNVSLIPEDGGMILLINLEDRFSLIPLPFFSYSDGKLAAGGFLMEGNLLGTGNSMFLGGMYGSGMTFLSVSYMHRNVFNSPVGLGGGLVFTEMEQEAEDTEGNLVFSDEGWSLGGMLTSRIDFDPFAFGLNLKSGYRTIEGVVSETLYIAPEISAGYDGQHLNEFYRDGLKGEVKYEQTFYSREFNPSGELRIGLQYDFLPHRRILLSAAADSLLFSGDELLSPSVRSPLLSDSVHALQQSQASFKLSPVIADFSWGFVALPLGYQAGILDGAGADMELYHGPWGGLMLYLKKVTIPALSIRYGLNAETGISQYSFSMGFQG